MNFAEKFSIMTGTNGKEENETMLKSIIFDMDGVLVNSEPVHYRAYLMALEKWGQTLS